MPLTIRGMGTAVPEQQVNQSDSMALAELVSADSPERAALVRRIQRRTQVQNRGSVLLGDDASEPIRQRLPFYGAKSPTTAARMNEFDHHASALAINACRLALEEAELAADVITHLVTVCCTGFKAPGVDLALIDQLELDPGVQRTHVGFMGCHGALNGLRVARAFAEADANAVVLLCSVELCSLHLHYGWDPEKVVANALFADGAAALVASQALAQSKQSLTLKASGSTVIPNTSSLMHWQVGDHGFAMGLSPQVPEAIAGALQPWLSSWLRGHGSDLTEIRSWALHPGGPRILQACADALALKHEHLAESRSVLQAHGNMSSATVLFILERMRHKACSGPCLALAFGPGLCAEVALFDLCNSN